MRITSALMSGALAAVAVTTALTAVPAAAQVAVPGPPTVKVTDVKFGGNGCPRNGTSVVMSNSNQAVDIIFSDFAASTSGVRSKDCQVNFLLEYPAGWSYSLIGAQYRGYTDVGAGSSAQMVNQYYFQGDSRYSELKKTYSGPREGTFQENHEADVTHEAPCKERRYLATRHTLGTQGASATINLDSMSVDVSTKVLLNWKPC
ncbi:DUF4360 domain-containing protein [Pilimelia terevasa]|nr:DUF4360 domain-containing protein [Pilimelia terevasa]